MPSCPRRSRCGLIPAHAGKTRNGASPASPAWAHPRLRGENALAVRVAVGDEGSSPLTRGKRHNDRRHAPRRGLIPAHAGKTSTMCPASFPTRAHPRSRGENQRQWITQTIAAGSSPLTRGKPASANGRSRPPGLIPAHAGKTAVMEGDAVIDRAHPRSRGENDCCHGDVYAGRGSSPLTRGKRRIADASFRRSGLIPAHAGKTPHG